MLRKYRTVKEWVPSAQLLLGVCSVSCYAGNVLLSLLVIFRSSLKIKKTAAFDSFKTWDHSFTFSVIRVAYSLLPSVIKNVTMCTLKHLAALKLRIVFPVPEDVAVDDVLQTSQLFRRICCQCSVGN